MTLDKCRVIVCGGRNYRDYAAVEWVLDLLLEKKHALTIMHGACSGADTLARDWAEKRCVEHLAFPADWNAHGRAAGPLRNRQMLDEGAQAVVAFPGGRGTADMIAAAKERGVPVWEPLAATNPRPTSGTSSSTSATA